VDREFPRLEHPIIQAPLGGGPSTPALAAAVSDAGGLGFLAGGYKAPEQLLADVAATRALTSAAFGVNLFVLNDAPVDAGAIARYAVTLQPLAERLGVASGEPRFEDDWLTDKLAIVCQQHVPIVSFTFGCPSAATIARLHEHDVAVWVTVTELGEARIASERGADALIVQGVEAGGHRGCFDDRDGHGEIGLLALLRLLASDIGPGAIGLGSQLALIASGGIADGAGVAAALVAGARVAQIGTAFMRCPEAATSSAHRELLGSSRPTALTRAFTGRRARGIVNAFMREHDADAPSAYPHVHHLTAPLRAAARATGDAETINLWAGQAHQLAEERPAAELVRRWSAEARDAIAQAQRRLVLE
jgi:nitronate monooxygenase